MLVGPSCDQCLGRFATSAAAWWLGSHRKSESLELLNPVPTELRSRHDMDIDIQEKGLPLTGLLKRNMALWLFPPKQRETTIYKAMFRCIMQESLFNRPNSGLKFILRKTHVARRFKSWCLVNANPAFGKAKDHQRAQSKMPLLFITSGVLIQKSTRVTPSPLKPPSTGIFFFCVLLPNACWCR